MSRQLWDLEGNIIASYDHKDFVWSAVFSPTEDLVLTASSDGTAKLWDFQGNIVTSFEHQDSVKFARFTPLGDQILTLESLASVATLWNLEGKNLAELDHQKTIGEITFSPMGNQILIADAFGIEATLWNVFGEKIAKLSFSSHQIISTSRPTLTSINFDQTGSQILTGSRDGTAKIWWNYSIPSNQSRRIKIGVQRGLTELECQQYFKGNTNIDRCTNTYSEKEAIWALLEE